MNWRGLLAGVSVTLIMMLLILVNQKFDYKMNLLWIQSPELDIEFAAFTRTDSSSDEIPEQSYPTGDDEYYFRNVSHVKFSPQCEVVKSEEKFDCFPENSVTLSRCLARGCCWQPTSARKKPTHTGNPSDPQAPVDVPYCYYPKNFPGYTVTSQKMTDTGFQATLQRYTTSHYPRDVMKLMMDVKYETATRLHIKISDPVSPRYEVPLPVPTVSTRAADVQYKVMVSAPSDPFSLTVTRKDAKPSDPPLFSSSGAAPLMFTDQYLQLSTFLPTHYIYGLGQHRDRLLHSTNWTRYTMWNRDQPPKENVNLYGSHPFYLALEKGGTSYGFFLLNSNAMDVILQPAPAVTWRTIGGVLDFYIFVGPSPASVVQQYLEVVGYTFMPPYWSLGLHVSRYGYKTVNQTETVVNNIRKYGIPQDVQWNDIDYAINSMSFTTDYKRFGDQPAMAKKFHKMGLHYCILIDPGMNNIQPKNTYPPYDMGIALDIFIKNETDDPLIGKVWTGTTVWPDFTNPMTQVYWSSLVIKFQNEVKFDGTLIDMNEVSSFVAGSIYGCQRNQYDDPPYTPAVTGGKLNTKTVCASSKQFLSRNYNCHNIYGSAMSEMTNQALKDARGSRPFLISRATFPGQSRYGAHWTGDNDASFSDMSKSIPEVLTMSMLGVSMNGADICGFLDNTTTQLCQRWYQLGAFYTFSWTHNSEHCHKEQDPAAFGEVFAASVRKVYLTRYSLLPYLYTLFHHSHVTGDLVARPLFFEFPNDTYTYTLDRQLLWGPALLISPVLEENATAVEAYFPSGVWYDFYTGRKIGKERSVVKLNAPLDVINLHVRGGFIIPMQEPALTTTESRHNKFTLLVAPDGHGQATGDLFWDDGDTIDTDKTGVYNEMKFNSTSNKLDFEASLVGYQTTMLLGNVTIFGVESQPSTVKLNNITQTFQYKADTQVLCVSTEVSMVDAFVLEWQ